MIHKFSDLLANPLWRVNFDGRTYSNDAITACLMDNIARWKEENIIFTDDAYYICVGFNSFHYFLYILLASLLNMKIILASAAQVATIQKDYSGLKLNHLITSRKISAKMSYIINFTLIFNNNACSLDLSDYLNNRKEAKIVFCTSGTTGKYKLVQYKERNLFNNAKVVGNYFAFNTTDVCLCLFPVNYMYGFSMLMSVLLKSGTVIIERTSIAAFRIFEYLRSNQITVFPILREIVDQIYPIIKKDNYSSERLMVINAADKIYQTQVKKIFKFARVFWNNFGQTESGPRLLGIKITHDDHLGDFVTKTC